MISDALSGGDKQGKKYKETGENNNWTLDLPNKREASYLQSRASSFSQKKDKEFNFQLIFQGIVTD